MNKGATRGKKDKLRRTWIILILIGHLQGCIEM